MRDMAELSFRHPEIEMESRSGKFTAKKTQNSFSVIALDQCHEQENAKIKGDGGAVGLTENLTALR